MKLNKKAVAFLTILAVPLLMANQGGCGGGFPTAQQVEFHLPQNIRTCKYAPKSPGAGASKKRVARYIIKLRRSWKHCHGNLAAVNGLYNQYRGTIEFYANGSD